VELNLVPTSTCSPAWWLPPYHRGLDPAGAPLGVPEGPGQAGEETPPAPETKIVVVVSQEQFNLVIGQIRFPSQEGDGIRLREAGRRAQEGQGRSPDKNDVQVASEDQVVFETSSARWTRY